LGESITCSRDVRQNLISGVTVFSQQRDMLDVSQIMKDLACMVHEQGDAIGKILCVCVRCVSVCLC